MKKLLQNKYLILSTRLANFDYSQPGFYFVTICTKNRQHYFGEIIGEEMVLNDIGKIVVQCWLEIPKHFPHVELDEFVVMPNHVHGIIEIKENFDVHGNTINTYHNNHRRDEALPRLYNTTIPTHLPPHQNLVWGLSTG